MCHSTFGGSFFFSNDIIFLLFGIGIPYYNRILYFRFTCNLFFIGMFVFSLWVDSFIFDRNYRFFSIAELWINDLYGLLGIYAIPNWIGIPFTILTIVFITNAINLIDGIDGLASGLSSVALLVFGLLFIEKGLWMYSMLAFSTLGVLVPFFYYNVFGNAERARKIFMGDTGSLTLGYILSFLAIKYSQNNPEVISNTKGTFLIAFSTLIIPAFDVIRVVMVRLRNGKSPFEPDKNHIHHKFLAMGFTPRKAMIIIILISCAFSVVNILLIPWVNNTVILIGDIVAWIALNLWWDKVRDKRTHLNRLY